MTSPSIFKRTYDGIALFAVLNLLVVGGFTAFLVGTGVVDGAAMKRVAAALREEEPEEDGEESAAAAAEETNEPAAEEGASQEPKDTPGDTGAGRAVMRQEADRIKEELRQRLALNNSILLRITTERESFRREREAAVEEDTADRAQTEQAGFGKQIEILQSIKPKMAVEHLLALGDPDEIAQMLLAMETRKAKKIVEAAKGSAQMEQMKLALRRLREVSPGRSGEIAPGE